MAIILSIASVLFVALLFVYYMSAITIAGVIDSITYAFTKDERHLKKSTLTYVWQATKEIPSTLLYCIKPKTRSIV